MSLPEPAGRYACVATSSLLGWLIRRATKSWADHALILLDSQTVLEATPHDVRTAPLAAAAARSYLGAEYNWADLGVIGLGELGLHWRILLRLAGGRKALICSELVALCGQAAGLDWATGRDPSQVTPADLARRAGMRPLRPRAQAARLDW